ncbi:MAG: S24/S26 family peptidase [Oscillospiraceae bacterium]|nr:S24/S26 family peptidase [Oscillospiraceae bacterium]
MKTRELTPQHLAEGVIPAIEAGGRFQLTVTGSSMAPTLHPGDAVLLEKAEKPKVGDILLFRRADGSYILHRCIAVSGGRLTMNGDAQSWTEQISPAQVCAVAAMLFRKGKWEKPGRLYGRVWPMTRRLRPVLLCARRPKAPLA